MNQYKNNPSPFERDGPFIKERFFQNSIDEPTSIQKRIERVVGNGVPFSQRWMIPLYPVSVKSDKYFAFFGKDTEFDLQAHLARMEARKTGAEFYASMAQDIDECRISLGALSHHVLTPEYVAECVQARQERQREDTSKYKGLGLDTFLPSYETISGLVSKSRLPKLNPEQ